MSKLIDLDAAINALGTIDCSDRVGISALKCDAVDDVITVIKELPTVDAVEVVRCAVCRYFRCNMRGDGTLPKGVDEFECIVGRGGYDPMGFCDYGERKDGGDGKTD